MYYTTKDMMQILNCGVNTARKYMQMLNKELEEQGVITFRGKVPKEYVKKRLGL